MRQKAIVNYAIVFGIALVFLGLSLIVRILLNQQVEGVAGDIEANDWDQIVTNWYIGAVLFCLGLSCIWLFASEHFHKIDWTGKHSQRAIWFFYLFGATLCVPLIGWAFFWPPAQKGNGFAVALLCGLAFLQFWIGTLLASPNPMSVVGGRMLRKRGVV